VSQESTNRSFDDLARALAEGSISRRRALKLFAGTAIAALIPSTRAMAAITCPPGTVKICHVPRRADGTCRRGAAETRCLTPEAAARHAGHPCDCCGGCGGTDDCREPRPRTCFSTSTTSTSTSTTSTSTTTPTTSTSTSTTSTTTPGCLPFGGRCTADTQCCNGICDSRLGECRNCRSEGSSCTSDTASQCCSDICDTDGTCCIVGPGCFTNADCCGVLSCVDGSCVRG
jgi:hypothetical protein